LHDNLLVETLVTLLVIVFGSVIGGEVGDFQ